MGLRYRRGAGDECGYRELNMMACFWTWALPVAPLQAVTTHPLRPGALERGLRRAGATRGDGGLDESSGRGPRARDRRSARRITRGGDKELVDDGGHGGKRFRRQPSGGGDQR